MGWTRSGDRVIATRKPASCWAIFDQPGIAQLNMFSEQLPRANADELMATLDKINKSGLGKIWFAGQGQIIRGK